MWTHPCGQGTQTPKLALVLGMETALSTCGQYNIVITTPLSTLYVVGFNILENEPIRLSLANIFSFGGRGHT